MSQNESPGETSPDLSMACVYTANGELEANTIRATLEAAGIPAVLQFEAVTKLFAVNVDGLGAVKILVPEDRADEARSIIETPARSLEPEE